MTINNVQVYEYYIWFGGSMPLILLFYFTYKIPKGTHISGHHVMFWNL